MLDWLRRRWRADGWAAADLRSWSLRADQLEAPPRRVRPDTPPFVPRDAADAQWHEALFWAALLNLPFGPALALVGFLDGEAHLAVLTGILGLCPSVVGFVLAFRLTPPEPRSVRVARTWPWVQGTVVKMGGTHAETGGVTYPSEPADGKAVWVTVRYSTPQGEEQGTLQLHADDPPLSVGDSVTLLVDPADPSSHCVLRRLGGVLFRGDLPASQDTGATSPQPSKPA